jgi:uncharacterized protein YbjT (DUF2867 family)
MAAVTTEAKAQYSAIVLGATGNVGGRIVQLLIENPLCQKVVVVTRRRTNAFADPYLANLVLNGPDTGSCSYVRGAWRRPVTGSRSLAP